ncbi:MULTISPECIES: hypothetical protein [unclassified Crossiella]|uniref:hypothetical protein n=1 Tax=unclassified Crossiella TaxID=2620835 RepID=UPI001FFE3862|nr:MULTISPECIES: hypothetical protein [unclassified Crossiella]MCK2239978.1 hypothetical protein [Crossiella sp. S99.2]MCK2252686.1 hypothetical protein [Crossiella sp. S99.1]
MTAPIRSTAPGAFAPPTAVTDPCASAQVAATLLATTVLPRLTEPTLAEARPAELLARRLLARMAPSGDCTEAALPVAGIVLVPEADNA